MKLHLILKLYASEEVGDSDHFVRKGKFAGTLQRQTMVPADASDEEKDKAAADLLSTLQNDLPGLLREGWNPPPA